MVHQIKPKFFIFENVRAFLTSVCTDVDGNAKSIKEAIEMNLGGLYNRGCRLILRIQYL